MCRIATQLIILSFNLLLEREQRNEPARRKGSTAVRIKKSQQNGNNRHLERLSLAKVLLLRDHPEASRTEGLASDGE